MPLYAATDDGMILDHKYQMSGNQIWVKTLDLYRKLAFTFSEASTILHTYTVIYTLTTSS